MRISVSGILYGLFASAAFGLIPFFTLPIVSAGYNIPTVLVYRFAIATAIMFLILLVGRFRLDIGWNIFFKVCGLALFYMLAVKSYFQALAYLPSGVVGTLQFQYPVMVLLIMAIFFHEPLRWQTVLAVLLAVAGVAFLSLGQEQDLAANNYGAAIGTILALLSGLFNGLYLIGIQVARLPKMDDLVFTFYIMLFGTAFCFMNALVSGSLQWLPLGKPLLDAVLLAIVTAVLSNIALVLAIHRAGSTLTSIMGVMEPLTAVSVGCLVFGEPFTTALALGMGLIAAAVFLALLRGK